MKETITTRADDVRRGAKKIITKDEIQSEIKRVANEIEGSIGNLFPVVLSILNGSICFSGQLITELDFAMEYDVFSMSRYGSGTTGGELKHLSYPTISVRNRTVLVLDDILDRGTTIESAKRWAMGNGATQVLTAILINKKRQELSNRIKPDFSCFTVSDVFVFGFGMDVGGMWRNLADIYELKNPTTLSY